jgi:hypothetical protein
MECISLNVETVTVSDVYEVSVSVCISSESRLTRQSTHSAGQVGAERNISLFYGLFHTACLCLAIASNVSMY